MALPNDQDLAELHRSYNEIVAIREFFSEVLIPALHDYDKALGGVYTRFKIVIGDNKESIHAEVFNQVTQLYNAFIGSDVLASKIIDDFMEANNKLAASIAGIPGSSS